MGNPVITRLGTQQFWHNHWYSDTNVSSNLQQDKLFSNLINLYLTYGLNIRENLFIHEYWYGNSARIKNLKINYSKTTHNIFYRRHYYLNNIVGIEHSFLLRNATAEYFPLKLWLFKFNNWIILNVTWFKPLKGKNKNKPFLGSASAANVLHKPTSSHFQSKRMKLLLTALFFKLKSLNKKYIF
jgi:hypothetical protein